MTPRYTGDRPTIGYADLITDPVSTGTTLRDNRLKRLEGGQILASQACLIGNRQAYGESTRGAAARTARQRRNSSPLTRAPWRFLLPTCAATRLKASPSACLPAADRRP
jgi:hypothetical protein